MRIFFASLSQLFSVVLYLIHSLLKKMVKTHFKEDFNGVFKHLSATGSPTEDDMRSLLFGDYLVPDAVCT